LRMFSRRDWIMGSLATCASARYAGAIEAVSLLSPISPGPRAAGETTDTKALQRAIDAASARGGGTVHLPPGHYVSGSLLLRSNVSLWLDNGAILTMSKESADFLSPETYDYDPKAGRSTADFRFALLAGDGVENVAIFGEGILEGNRTSIGGPKSIALRRCSHISVRGITIRNSAGRAISMLGCEFVDIDGVTVEKGTSDGIDPDCSRYVRISNCFVESVDDSMCLKASGALGERRATEYVTVENCVLRTASIHFKCGTESCGDFRGITVSNCVFQGGMGTRHGNPGIALYTTDGGALEDIAISNIVMRDVGVPLAIVRGNRDSCSVGSAGPLRSIRLSNLLASGARLPSVIAGFPNAEVGSIAIDGFSITMASTGTGPGSLDMIPEASKAYPQPVMFGPLPAFGLFLRHVLDISLRDVMLQPAPQEVRPAIVADDVAGLRLFGYNDRSGDSASHLWFRNVRDSMVECVATSPAPDRSYRVEGAKTSNLHFKNSSGPFDRQRILEVGPGVPPGAIQSS
jgi:Pectate lyase superfamily protein